jgi:hypothetical protein
MRRHSTGSASAFTLRRARLHIRVFFITIITKQWHLIRTLSHSRLFIDFFLLQFEPRPRPVSCGYVDKNGQNRARLYKILQQTGFDLTPYTLPLS